ncbi:hypothetical protein LP416_23115 [Polaromonas sp. P2-4]|nr:hypothetical protein LP416_23115 [Polaromonas sp. P2-4]
MTLVFALTALVVTLKLALLAPAATVTLAGTPAAAGLLLESVTSAPPEGAAAVKVAVPVEEVGPTTLVGFTDTEDKLAAAVAACGVKRRVLENGPKTPAEFCALHAPPQALRGQAAYACLGDVDDLVRPEGR